MTTIFDGKGFSANVDRSIEKDASIYMSRHGRAPKLCLISTASSQDQESYIKSKIKKGARIGVEVETIRFDETSGEEEIIDKIEFLNESDSTDGIMVESPVRQGLNAAKIYSHISGRKDVDSQNPLNLGLIMLNKANVYPATARAILEIINSLNLDIGSEVVVINRSNIIGKPLSMMLLNSNYTIKVCHSKTKNFEEILKSAETVVTAIGKYKFFSGKDFRMGVNIVDASINFNEKEMAGDCDISTLTGIARFITPVPGGVGPVTSSMLFRNLMDLLNSDDA